jgi:two-component system LytT family response regulator
VSLLRVLVCDDEAMARKRAHRLLSALPDVTVDAVCSSAAEVRAALASQDFDVLVLDVQMPDETGLELAATLPEPRPFLVFATAHARHAVDAFDDFALGAVDYVLKPLEEERLAKAIARARVWLDSAPLAATATAPHLDPVTPIALATHQGVVLLAPAEISHCTFDGQLATVHAQGRAVLTDLTMNELAQKLPHLLRVHRRSLLSLAHVDRLEPRLSGGYRAHLRGGGSAEVSRQAARELRRRLR